MSEYTEQSDGEITKLAVDANDLLASREQTVERHQPQLKEEVQELVNSLPVIKVDVLDIPIKTKAHDDMVMLERDEEETEEAIRARQYDMLVRRYAWWIADFTEEQGTQKNPFEGHASEQLFIGDGPNKTVLYNFGEHLTPTQIEEIQEVFRDVYQYAGDRLFEKVKHIVIHDQFIERERADGRKVSAKGRTHTFTQYAFDWDGVIELNGKKVFQEKGADEGSLRTTDGLISHKSTLQTTLVHEIAHAIGNGVQGGWLSSFGWSSDFAEVHSMGEPSPDMKVLKDGEYVSVPKASIYSEDQLATVAPVSQYGEARGAEDYAEALTMLIYKPDQLDPVRRDLLLSYLQDPNYPKLRPDYDRQPDYSKGEQWPAEKKAEPRDIAVSLEDKDRVFTMERRVGEQITYPEIPMPDAVRYWVASGASYADLLD